MTQFELRSIWPLLFLTVCAPGGPDPTPWNGRRSPFNGFGIRLECIDLPLTLSNPPETLLLSGYRTFLSTLANGLIAGLSSSSIPGDLWYWKCSLDVSRVFCLALPQQERKHEFGGKSWLRSSKHFLSSTQSFTMQMPQAKKHDLMFKSLVEVLSTERNFSFLMNEGVCSVLVSLARSLSLSTHSLPGLITGAAGTWLGPALVLWCWGWAEVSTEVLCPCFMAISMEAFRPFHCSEHRGLVLLFHSNEHWDLVLCHHSFHCLLVDGRRLWTDSPTGLWRWKGLVLAD